MILDAHDAQALRHLVAATRTLLGELTRMGVTDGTVLLAMGMVSGAVERADDVLGTRRNGTATCPNRERND